MKLFFLVTMLSFSYAKSANEKHYVQKSLNTKSKNVNGSKKSTLKVKNTTSKKSTEKNHNKIIEDSKKIKKQDAEKKQESLKIQDTTQDKAQGKIQDVKDKEEDYLATFEDDLNDNKPLVDIEEISKKSNPGKLIPLVKKNKFPYRKKKEDKKKAIFKKTNKKTIKSKRKNKKAKILKT